MANLVKGPERKGGRRKGQQEKHVAAIDPAEITRLVGERMTLTEIAHRLGCSRRWLFDNPVFRAAKAEGMAQRREFLGHRVMERWLAVLEQDKDRSASVKAGWCIARMWLGADKKAKPSESEKVIRVIVEYADGTTTTATPPRIAAASN